MEKDRKRKEKPAILNSFSSFFLSRGERKGTESPNFGERRERRRRGGSVGRAKGEKANEEEKEAEEREEEEEKE